MVTETHFDRRPLIAIRFGWFMVIVDGSHPARNIGVVNACDAPGQTPGLTAS